LERWEYSIYDFIALILNVEKPFAHNSEKPRGVKEDIAKSEYRAWILSRPPFSYKTLQADYPEIDETLLFQMEHRVYHMSDWILESEDRLGSQYSDLFRKYRNTLRRFKSSIQTYKSLDQLAHSKSLRQAKNSLTTVLEAREGRNGQSRILKFFRERFLEIEDRIKDERENFFKWQSNLLKTQFALLAIISQESESETIKAESLERLDETETILLAVKAYEKNKSFTHDDELLRQSGELTMNHIYQMCIHNMRRVLIKLEDPSLSHLERRRLYRKLKMNLKRDMDHDSREDLEHLKEEDHIVTDIRLSGLDTREISKIRTAGWQESLCIPFSEYGQTKSEVDVLTKTKCPLLKQHACPIDILRYKILDNPKLTDEQRLECIISKLHDRHHNLWTLKYMKAKYKKGVLIETAVQRKTRKIEETVKLIALAYEIRKSISEDTPDKDDLFVAINGLIRLSQNECDQLAWCSNDRELLQRLASVRRKLESKKSGLI